MPMVVFGFGPGAQVIVLQAVATYAAIGSAYLLLRPVQRSQLVQQHRDVLASISGEGDVGALIAQASAALAEKAQGEAPKATKDNRWGSFLLALSFALFSLALRIQFVTDPAFKK